LGCRAQGLERGLQHYENGRFGEALTEFERAEATLPCLSRSDEARYTLYRGLTELALGNANAARAWLLRTQRALEREPPVLEGPERARLASAWQSLGLLPAQR
jgi:tetratricopeptide (TPR) repeat protein